MSKEASCCRLEGLGGLCLKISGKEKKQSNYFAKNAPLCRCLTSAVLEDFLATLLVSGLDSWYFGIKGRFVDKLDAFFLEKVVFEMGIRCDIYEHCKIHTGVVEAPCRQTQDSRKADSASTRSRSFQRIGVSQERGAEKTITPTALHSYQCFPDTPDHTSLPLSFLAVIHAGVRSSAMKNEIPQWRGFNFCYLSYPGSLFLEIETQLVMAEKTDEVNYSQSWLHSTALNFTRLYKSWNSPRMQKLMAWLCL